MKIESVLPALRAGKKIRRKTWFDVAIKLNDILNLTLEEFLADDWEVVPEKVKKWQFTYWDEASQMWRISFDKYASLEDVQKEFESASACVRAIHFEKFLPSEIEVEDV